VKLSYLLTVSALSFGLFNFNCFANQQYPDVTITPFPIMTWVPPALTEQQLGWYKQAGFNVMFIYPDEQAYTKLKEHWDGNWMVFKEWNRKGYNFKTMCDFHANDPKRIGFMLGDEPITAQIDEYVEQYDYLRGKHPGDICLVNMFPSGVSQTRLGTTYREYMDTYFKKLRPRYCSLDNYPCLRFNVDSPNYYHDLEMIRETAQKHNCKVFGFVQLYSSQATRDISESDLAWQVNSLLAHDCKGLWYFYFRHPMPGINELAEANVIKLTKHETALNYPKGRALEEYYRDIYTEGSGVLNANDQPGERFADVSRINRETLAWGDVLIGLKSLKVRHILGCQEGFPPVGADEFARKGWSDAEEKYIADVRADDHTKSMGYIISYFEDGHKKPYIMIVNKRHGEFMSCKGGLLKTTVAFTKEVKNAYLVSNKTSKEEKIQLSQFNAFEREIEGGGAILLRLELNDVKEK
jgi:hypothetical protein